MTRVAAWWLLWAACVNAAEEKLQCYQCLVTENRLCTNDSLLPCPNDQAFDRCMTVISNNKEEGYRIEKKCALAPCSLRDPDQNTGLGLDHCDQSRAEFNCISCCRGDGCNRDGSHSPRPLYAPVVLPAVLLLAFFYPGLYPV